MSISVTGDDALLVIDVQKGFDDPHWGPRNNPDCEARIAKLVMAWRQNRRPVVFVRHDSVNPESPLRPGQPGNALRDELHGPPDLLVSKTVNSAFYGTPDLHMWLSNRSIDTVFVCGMTTNHCCETTARMAANLGYKVFFILDATMTHDRAGPDGVVVTADELTRATAASLHEEFATVVRTQDILPD